MLETIIAALFFGASKPQAQPFYFYGKAPVLEQMYDTRFEGKTVDSNFVIAGVSYALQGYDPARNELVLRPAEGKNLVIEVPWDTKEESPELDNKPDLEIITPNHTYLFDIKDNFKGKTSSISSPRPGYARRMVGEWILKTFTAHLSKNDSELKKASENIIVRIPELGVINGDLNELEKGVYLNMPLPRQISVSFEVYPKNKEIRKMISGYQRYDISNMNVVIIKEKY